jgi:DNA polymerase (family X)
VTCSRCRASDPKTVRLLQQVLGVTDVPSLTTAIEDGRLAQLPGMGEKTLQNLTDAITKLGLTSKDQRVPITDALPVAERIVAALDELPGVADVAYAGSLRRFRDTIGDVDLLVATEDPAPVREAFLARDEVDRVLGSGETKTSVVTRDGLQIDLRVVPPASFGAALVYFTGSKAHNIRLRQRALERGWTLNEYALADHDDPSVVVAAATEEAIYAALELPWITPELREDDGELEAALAGTLPVPLQVADVRGDLHVHTDLSGDGREPLETMVAAAAERGLAYVAITDHAENLTINGVSREAMEASAGGCATSSSSAATSASCTVRS